MSVAIDIQDLHVRRGRTDVLHGFTCQIAPGQVTGLLGPSGSGKTTLMRAIVGVQIVASGTVTVLGLPAGSPELRGRMGYVTQAPSVYRDLTVVENVEYFADLAGAPRRAVTAIIDEVGLRDQARQLAGTLSGGQFSRVSLASALVGDPEVLILDEPTVGQDPLLREEVWNGLHRRARAGATILVSSHVMDEARRCDEVLLLRQGDLLAQASPAAILERVGAPDLDAAFLAMIKAA